MKGIILHGGHGTRLRPLTHTGPKQLLPIANKPMSQYCVESLIDAGITEIAIIIGGNGSEKVKEFYGDGKNFGVNFTYFQQDYPKGISHAINLCKEFVGNKKFVVFLGDNIIQKSIKKYVKEFEITDASASLLLCKVPNPSSFGIAEIEDEKIVKIIEKPKNSKSDLAVTGIYCLTPLIFDIIKNLKPSWRNELEITDALQILLSENNKISYHIITDYWKDTGTPEDIINANRAILENKESYFHGEKSDNSTIIGTVLVGKGTKILGTSKIEGPVILGENCIIKNVCIGPNTSIGNNSKLENCTIENSIIMEDCKIDCPIQIDKSIISTNSQITVKNNENENKIFLLGEGTRIII